MNRIIGCLMALGLSLGLAGQAGAAPVSAASAPMTRQAESLSSALVAEIGYHRRHHRGYGRAYHHGPRGHAYGRRLHHRPAYHRPAYRRPVHYRPVHYRPVRYRPVHYRPVHRPVRYAPIYAAPIYAAPVYYGGYGAGPECYVKVRKVHTWSGIVRKHVRVCQH